MLVTLSTRLSAQNYQQTSQGVKAEVGRTTIELQFYSSGIVRVLKYPKTEKINKKSLSVVKIPEKTDFKTDRFNNVITLSSSEVIVTLNLTTGDVQFNGLDTRPFIAEKSSSSLFTEKQYKSGKTCEIQQTFLLDKQEAVYGLGQHQQGYMNQRGKSVRLRQVNTEIAVPIIHSTKGYAVFWDNYSETEYKVSVGGVYDNQRKVTADKRVYIFTRSAFAGQQRYGANSWSGDIDSGWSALRKQIPAGLNFSLCGIPYWNTDIGGFRADRAYPEGIKDIAFHELYVRWLQFGTFTPMMRSHGTNTPREIYQFGKRGDWAFDVQEKYINMRYNLMPYMYSIGHDITNNSGSMMRALMMDFVKDPKVYDIDNRFMFGKSILVAPVTDSMYVNRTRDGWTVADFSTVKIQKIYLPEGADWYDFWTGEKIKGGQEISKAAPIDIIPLYIKAGTILPWGPKVQYAEEKNWDNLDIFIYPGTDTEFVLYEDENDNYNYEKGIYSTIKMKWNDTNQTLTIGTRKGEFPGMLSKRTFRITLLPVGKSIWSSPDKADRLIVFEGKGINVKM
jgi:alpha-glucosidase (family GH31 glycosyl hydrolase)